MTIAPDNSANPRPGTAQRYAAVLIGLVTLSLSCWWMVPIAFQQQPELAAQIGVLRGDLWDRAGWSRLKDSASNEAEDSFRNALALSPMNAEAWFGLALSTAKPVISGGTSDRSASALKMSYYTGFNIDALLTDRLMLLVNTEMSHDPELQDILKRQVALIVTRRPAMAPVLRRAYSLAGAANRQLIASKLSELGTDPNIYFGRSS